jgi:hypothetical protein
MAGEHGGPPGHWAVLQSPDPRAGWGCRVDSVGVRLPPGRLTTSELMTGRLAEARDVLLLAAGAGITGTRLAAAVT